jgi:putative transposase
MPDTPRNQAEYPQPRSQAPGLGFPIARLVVVFSLAVGTVLDAAMGPYRGKQTGELALLRMVIGEFRPGDIVLADRLYCSYWAIATLKARGVDVVMRLHQRRRSDFRCGQRLGPNDHVAVWKRPEQVPDWMSRAEYEAMPKWLPIREVRVKVADKTKRVRQLVIATTLLDAKEYPIEELAALFRRRWHAEVCQADDIPRCGLYPSARWAHSERGGAAAPGPLVPGAPSRHRRADAMRSDSERPVPPRTRAA